MLPGGWVCERPLAEGAFAVVFEGRSPTGKRVAIKVPTSNNPQAIPRFKREIKVLRSMPENQYVVAYRGHGSFTDGRPFLAMELVEGNTLERLMSGAKPLADKPACELMLQLCDSLAILHVLGLSHGDIKPANIMITRGEQQVKLLDFGMVRDSRGLFKAMEEQRLLPGREFDAELDAGLMAGTPEYVAPEQIADARATRAKQVKRGPPADVFALAVIFYRLLTGRRLWPFEPQAKTIGEYQKQARVYLDTRQRLDTDALDCPPDINPALWSIIAHALRRDPSRRQPDATALKADIQRYLDTGMSALSNLKSPQPQIHSVSGLMRYSKDGAIIQHTDLIRMETGWVLPKWLLAGLTVGAAVCAALFYLN